MDQEKELRVRLFWEWPKKHKQENSKENFCICLYGLDTLTQINIVRGIINKEDLIVREKEKYFEYKDELKGFKIKKDMIDRFTKYANKKNNLWRFKDEHKGNNKHWSNKLIWYKFSFKISV